MNEPEPTVGPQPWHAFDGPGNIDERLARLGEPPPWRDFRTRRQRLARTYKLEDRERNAVNAALHLRRPLLVTGPPGSGKSSLAYAVADNLGLGDVLRWPINSRSTLAEGLYTYDAIARLRDVQACSGADPAGAQPTAAIGRYIRLGALGTALCGWADSEPNPPSRPRVLLVDEIDKSDIDLPNDLLHVLEEGEFEIPELARLANYEGLLETEVGTADRVSAGGTRRRVRVENGIVQCRVFPFILITSNGERDLPPAFFRRCLRLDFPPRADQARLRQLVEAHFGTAPPPVHLTEQVIDRFLAQQGDRNLVANDQLLNALYLVMKPGVPVGTGADALLTLLLRELNK
ncbi:hypothetical protein VT84_12570 [Gemmata sp. SH-PL17]|uniref:AAA family ATPase n=1 Tax=Gemmata sp. SH-PL17 TaxID=1630693 RepID=UPI00078D437C|nr:MoxR family ATPase [Gemmata sp. SH-PL17]AMV25225.1 hypothetical protein VT84_12570 [Gemmata sp. SH-PL17]